MVGTVVIKRVFNNNVAMVTSDDGSELIVIGRGLCFGRHAGDAIDEASVEKTYALQEGTSQDSRTIDRLAHLLESIPTVNLVISEDIVQMLRRELNVDINDKILIALADHISLALERERKGVPLLVANIGPATFGQDDNALLLIDDAQVVEIARADKLSLARMLVREIAQRVPQRVEL